MDIDKFFELEVVVEENLIICFFVVIIMGYVDYGKIILLDILCYFCVILGEVGGIM